MAKILGVGFVVAITTNSWATIAMPANFVCPICKTEFSEVVLLSRTTVGKRFDYKPRGAGPWPLVVCPTDSYVFFGEDRSDEELAVLRKYVPTEEYQSFAKSETSYFLVAKMQERLNYAPQAVANSYLRASWEVPEADDRLPRYQQLTLSTFESYDASNPKHDSHWVASQLISGELERRLGFFEEATQRFLRLKKMKEFQEDGAIRIIDAQLGLLAVEDADPH